METFIKATEVWVPASNRARLELAGGLYGTAHQFGALSRSMCFARGEGLPHRTWDEGRPIVLKDLVSSYFLRGVAARAAGLSCAISMPWFRRDVLSAVLVFFCADPGTHAGAIELWHHDACTGSDTTWVDGHCGAVRPVVEPASHDTDLPLEATVWTSDLDKPAPGLRAVDMPDVDTDGKLSFACTTPDHDTFVVTFLAGSATPIARRIQRWTLDKTGQKLQLEGGLCKPVGPAQGAPAEIVLGGDAGVIGRAFASGVPCVSEDAGAQPHPVRVTAAAANLTSLVAIPLASGDQVTQVVALYF